MENPNRNEADEVVDEKTIEKEVAVEEEVEVVEEEMDGATRWLTFLSSLAGVVSWLLLALMTGIAVFTGWNAVTNSASTAQTLFSLATGSLYTLLMGLFYFVVLQAVARGIHLLLDIRDSTEYLVEDDES